MVLDEAKIGGQTFDEQNYKYEEALSVSLKKGYAVLVKRDVDEIFTNTYNPEWIKSWNANMDISVFQDDHLEKKSICQTPFLGVLGLYIHPLKDRLPQTSVEGCPEDLLI